jgi:hypothetical protein
MSQNGCLRSCASPWTPRDHFGGKLGRSLTRWLVFQSRLPTNSAVQSLSIPCAPVVLIFFTAGLLYLLRFERVDNLGAYSIPSETGFLIPSDFVS